MIGTQSVPRRILLPVICRRHCSLGLAHSEPHPWPLCRPHYATPSQPPGSDLFRAPAGEYRHSQTRQFHLGTAKHFITGRKYIRAIQESGQALASSYSPSSKLLTGGRVDFLLGCANPAENEHAHWQLPRQSSHSHLNPTPWPRLASAPASRRK